MRGAGIVLGALVISSAASAALRSQTRGAPPAVVYEGARLVIGTATAPIDNGAFVVQAGRITAIGPRAAVKPPTGASRVDLTGKTVMPAMVNAHGHFGYERFTKAEGESLPENYNPDNLLDHMQRQAFYGVGTANDGGSAAVPIALAFQSEQAARRLPPAATYTFNAGIVPPNGGPDSILIKGTRPLRANYEVIRAPEGRAAVQDVVAKGIKHVKIWLGDRNGSYPAMPYQVYDAIIDEAHKNGVKVHAHATTLRDQKDALRAGADVLVHMVQNARIDDELKALVQEKRPYWATVVALGDRSDVCDGDAFFEQSLSAHIIADIRANACRPNPNAATREETLKANFNAMIQSGARLVLGSDTGVRPGNAFGSGDHHEIAHWVQMGLSPADAIVAATSRPAEMLGLADVGVLALGKQADFVVLNANPLDDIRNTRQIASVYLRGARLDRDALVAGWQGGSTVTAATADTYPATNGAIAITTFLHSSVQLEHAGTVIQVDPWSVGDLSRAKPADLILVTDDPGHHLDVKAIQRLRKPGAPVVITANGRKQVPDGMVLANGQSATLAGVRVESIAAYDLKPGAPEHPKGEANGYLVTLGGRRIYFAGVTECVPELRALTNIDVAFMPMNIPPGRMTPADAVACTKALGPKVVYVNHYDQDAAARLTNPNAKPQGLPGGVTVPQTLQAFKDGLAGSAIEVRLPDWYSTR